MGYKEGAAWAGHQRWECEDCPFDSLDEQAMIEHVGTAHAPAETAAAPEAASVEEEEEEEE